MKRCFESARINGPNSDKDRISRSTFKYSALALGRLAIILCLPNVALCRRRYWTLLNCGGRQKRFVSRPLLRLRMPCRTRMLPCNSLEYPRIKFRDF